MKPNPLRRLFSLFLSMLAVISLFPTKPVHAAGSNVSVSPGTQTVQRGQSFTVQLRGYISSDFLGASRVAGGLTFPANLLQVTDVNTSAATLNWQKTHSIGAGVVNFDQRSFLPIDNTNIAIGSVTFRTLASGTATVGFTGATSFSYNNTAIATARGTGSYTITTPPPTTCPTGQVGTPPNCTTPPPATCPTGQTGTPPNCVTPTPSTPNNPSPTKPQTPTTPQTPTSPTAPSTPTPSPDITEDVTGEADQDENGFSISDVTATRGYDSTLLNWKISEASKATVAYGTSLKDLSKTVDASQKPDGSYEAELTDLTPGKQYYYTISATADSDAAKTDSYSGVFTARGFPVIVSVTEDKSPATNAKIKIGEQNYSTDKNGRISLELASGSYTAEIKTSKGTRSFTLAVTKKPLPENGNAPEIQRFSFDIQASAAATPTNNDFLLLIGGLITAILVVGGILFLLWRRRQSQDQQATTMIAADNDYAWAPPQANTTTSYPSATSFSPSPDATTPINQDTYVTTPDQVPAYSMPAEPTALPQQEPSSPSFDIAAEPADAYSVAPSVEETPSSQAMTMTQEPPQPYPSTPQDEAISAPVMDTAAPPDGVANPATDADIPQQQMIEPDNTSATPAAQVIETPSGSELQINHEERHNSVYIDEEEPKDMFDTANNK